jgi:hypothetical protein
VVHWSILGLFPIEDLRKMNEGGTEVVIFRGTVNQHSEIWTLTLTSGFAESRLLWTLLIEREVLMEIV